MSKFVKFISKKQIGVIYAASRRGEMNLTEEEIKFLYNEIAESHSYAIDRHDLAEACQAVADALDMIFRDGNYTEAEELIRWAFRKYNGLPLVDAEEEEMPEETKKALEELDVEIADALAVFDIEKLEKMLEDFRYKAYSASVEDEPTSVWKHWRALADRVKEAI